MANDEDQTNEPQQTHRAKPKKQRHKICSNTKTKRINKLLIIFYCVFFAAIIVVAFSQM